MADADAGSMRTSHPKGIPDGDADASLPNEDRMVADTDGPARIDGGHVSTAANVYDAHMDAGQRRTEPPKDAPRGDKPDRQNDAGELADEA